MIRCNHCGANNLDGSEYCDECGTKLTTAEAPPPPSFTNTKDNVTPKPATPYTPPPPPAHPSVGHSLPGDPADAPPDRGADRVRDQAPNRAPDPAPKPTAP